MKINQLLDGIEHYRFVIPEFQREYVWPIENAKQLIVSLFRGYPTGSLLFWETKKPPAIKNDAVDREKIGLTTVILDGQQRLTTLYLFLKGEIPPYYTEKDLLSDPRHLYFNLETGEFLYYMQKTMNGNPLWKSVVSCFTEQFDAFTIMEEIETSDKLELGKKVNGNLNQLRGILSVDYPIQTIPTSSLIDEAIDVFDRVNSLGTKLTDAELVLTHVTGKWPQARKVLKEKLEKLDKKDYWFNLGLLTRCLVVSLTSSARLEYIDYGKYEKGDYVLAWNKASKAIDFLVPIMKKTAHISSTKEMSTNNVIVPIVAYLITHDCKFPKDTKNGFLYWMFLALIWSRYSGQTDQRLDKDVHIAINDPNPIPALVNEIEDQRGRTEVKASDLEGRGAGHPLHKILFIVTKSNKAVDWANGGSLEEPLGDGFQIQSHHIFPQALLYKNGYNSDNLIDKKKVNAIANRAFISRDTNYEISAKNPSDYLTKVEEMYPGALKQQFIPQDTTLWNINKYEEFLTERRTLIARAINSFLDIFKGEIKKVERQINWKKIIKEGENDFVEFKSSLRWDLREKRVNKTLELSVLKTIAGFLNSEGGTLLIGIDDDGNILGLENDFTILRKKNTDGFMLKLIELINNSIGKQFSEYLLISFHEIKGQYVCSVEVERSDEPIYVKHTITDKDGKKEEREDFFKRFGASTQPLGMKETQEYIALHFNK